MGTPPLSRELARQAVDAMNAARRLGKGTTEAARIIGIKRSALQTRIDTARVVYGYEPDEEVPAPVEVVEIPEARPRIRVKANRTPDDAPVYRVLAIGDAHDSSEVDKDRFRWFGRHAAQMRPDAVVFIGDIADFDSLSRHAAPGSLGGRHRVGEPRHRPSYGIHQAICARCDIGVDMGRCGTRSARRPHHRPYVHSDE